MYALFWEYKKGSNMCYFLFPLQSNTALGISSPCLIYPVKPTGDSDVVLDEADVVLGFGREVVPLPCGRRVGLPPREGFVLNLDLLQNLKVGYIIQRISCKYDKLFQTMTPLRCCKMSNVVQCTIHCRVYFPMSYIITNSCYSVNEMDAGQRNCLIASSMPCNMWKIMFLMQCYMWFTEWFIVYGMLLRSWPCLSCIQCWISTVWLGFHLISTVCYFPTLPRITSSPLSSEPRTQGCIVWCARLRVHPNGLSCYQSIDIYSSRNIVQSFSHNHTWKVGNSFSIDFVCYSNFNLIQHIQNVEFCQGNSVTQSHSM